ncbi:peptide chain release factor N(5)-glutamine methyltransferase [Sphingomonas morindae]|uniref:Release factor glutamine methyltransferase n=1 Tax=Sphingomonas morindae TaxID=1541170 RepID=A0ABY4XB14_9SPHN|nr:peptide chain release factor N(5)-glutamine methyltransferase [Sphingomonas morindae]USI74139.1 peptide chain release factor N(5)-glutamine methyltransferase [Sphingomonas morindae]
MPAEGRRAALRRAAAQLAACSATPRLDAELLMADALGIERETLLLGADGPVPDGFAARLARRAAGEPIAYIVGGRDFWDMHLAVGPGVLIPRPDSETLIEAAIAHFAGSAGPRTILDLGTGSGALLLAALRHWPAARGVGIDRAEAALATAAANAAALGLSARAEIRAGDWSGTGDRFDLILCNPPYIGTGETLPRDVVEHEPHGALFAGEDGLDAYRALLPLLPAQLAPAGVACVEIGWSQADAVAALARAQGLSVAVRHDLAGHARCLAITG